MEPANSAPMRFLMSGDTLCGDDLPAFTGTPAPGAAGGMEAADNIAGPAAQALLPG